MPVEDPPGRNAQASGRQTIQARSASKWTPKRKSPSHWTPKQAYTDFRNPASFPILRLCRLAGDLRKFQCEVVGEFVCAVDNPVAH
jgi:hypothetical protein